MPKARPPAGRPPPRIGRGGIGPPGGRVPTRGTKKAGKPSGGGNSGKPPKSGKSTAKGACDMWIPVAVALMPYALVRLAIDSLRSRRTQ